MFLSGVIIVYSDIGVVIAIWYLLDWQKSPQDRYREDMLLKELVQVVDKRNELVMVEERDHKL